METYAAVYFGAAILAMCLVPIVSQLGKRVCLLEVHGPNTERHNLSPRIGGIVIVIATMAMIMAAVFLNNTISQALHESQTDFTILLIIGLLVFVVGLTDDLFSLSGKVKLTCLILASLAICASGTTLKSISVGHSLVIETGLAAWPLTIAWIVMISVCMSFIDGLDGLAGGIAAIVCGTIALMAILSNEVAMAILMIAMLGSVTGFLFFNFHPAKIFMGGSGSMFLGFMIGAGSLVCETKTYTLIGLAIPFIVMGLPILEMLFSATSRRIHAIESLSSPSRSELRHRLQAIGLNQWVVVVIYYAVTTVSAIIGVFMLRAKSGWSIQLGGASLLVVYSTFLCLTWRLHHKKSPVEKEIQNLGMTRADTQESKSPAILPLPLDIVGIPVTPFKTYNEAVACIENAVTSNCKWFCAAINPIKIYNAWHDPALKSLLQQDDVVICDGMGVAKASHILYAQKIARITGCDLFFELLGVASRKQWGVYLLGASAQSNAGARKALEARYPDLKIVGCQDGYFKNDDDVIQKINASGAKFLFVAMGSPKQEQWICRHRQAIDANFCMGVGGSFDVAAGRVKRAPRIFRMTGTEFLFRIALEPRKRLSQQKMLLNFVTRVISTRLSAPRQTMPVQLQNKPLEARSDSPTGS
jgi:exopolysaccharide biosynthesis WecB/TagA/CpsF family protein